MNLHEQARAEAEKRWPVGMRNLRSPEYGSIARVSFEEGFLAGHEAAQPPCDGGCTYGDGPVEHCSRHGRSVAEVWQIVSDVQVQRDEAQAAARPRAVRAPGDTMTDDLLDKATRLAAMTQEDITLPWRHAEALAPIVRALVERVQQAEDAVEVNASEAAIFLATANATRIERDEARGKLDEVRHEVEHWRAMIRTGSGEYVDGTTDAYDRVLAILDGKE